jgi:hypothetical protein
VSNPFAIQIRPKPSTEIAQAWPREKKRTRLWAWVKWGTSGRGKNKEVFVAGYTCFPNFESEEEIDDIFFPAELQEERAEEVNVHFNMDGAKGLDEYEIRIWEEVLEAEKEVEESEEGAIERPSAEDLVKLEARGLLENRTFRKAMPPITLETLKALKEGKKVDWPELAQLSAFLLEELSQRPKPLSVSVRSLCQWIAQRHERLLSNTVEPWT